MNKRLVVALAVVSISASATVAFAGMRAGTGINGSWHDLNSDANGKRGYNGDSLGRTCVFCHTPHNALVDNPLAPLWNHENSRKSFAVYNWVAPTNKAITIDTDPLIGPSRLCMACHDGAIAVDAHGSADGVNADWTPKESTKTGQAMNATYTDALGNTAKRQIVDLQQQTHPIGFLYDEAFEKRPGELVNKYAGFITGIASSDAAYNTHDRPADYTNAFYSQKKINDTLYGARDGGGRGGYMTCATCHDVHNSVNATPEDGHVYNYFLYAKEEGSAICLSCHIK